jgi:hypothetical protein
MKRFRFQIQMICIISLFMILAFGCSTSSNLTTTPVNTSPAESTSNQSELTETPSPLPPSKTPTTIPPSPTETSTLEPTETSTNTPPPTATEAPPSVVVDQESGCRAGPSTSYRILAFLSPGDTGIMDGRTENSNWVRIQLLDAEQPCWVFSDFVTLESDLALVAVITPVPLPTGTAGPTKEPSGPKYFLIIPNNGGPFACGDGLVYYYSNKKGKSLEDDITIALNALFSVQSEYVGDYYNPLYKSSLRVKDVEVVNGLPTIWLGGKFVKPKTDCDAKRMHLQVWETARQFGGVTKRPIIWVNNVLLGDLLVGREK